MARTPSSGAMIDESVGGFLARLTAKLGGAGIPYMVVGSFASSFHGVPRSSRDLELVIDPLVAPDGSLGSGAGVSP
jgi:hypothetical protein